MNAGTDLDHIILLAPPWGPIKHRPHHLARALIKVSGCKVLYVEDMGRGAYLAWLRFWAILTRIEPGLFALRSFKVVPFQSKIHWARGLNERILALAIRLSSRIIGLRKVVLWHWSCQSHGYTGKLSESIVVYDSACETSLFSWATDEIRAMEKLLLHKSDLAFVATEPLRQIAVKDNPNTFILAQAVDWDYFEQALEKKSDKPAELASLKGPIIGFTGNIHGWIDGGILRECALRKPEWHFVLIGPVREIGDTDTEIGKIRGLENVHLLGARPYEQLIRYVAWFDVCIIPYKLNETAKVSETVKFYEYLATGKPIVATALPPLKRWSEVVYLAETPEEFVECIVRALEEPQTKVSRKRELARENTWDARARTALLLIRGASARKHASFPSETSRDA